MTYLYGSHLIDWLALATVCALAIGLECWVRRAERRHAKLNATWRQR